MHWVLQENIFNEEGWNSLVDVLVKSKISFSKHKVVPFIGELEPAPQISNDKNVIVMGSHSMALYARSKGWIPGSFANDNHDFRIQVAHWGDNMLNSSAKICRLADVRRQEEPFFVRPVDDGKTFPGAIMDWGEFFAWRSRILSLAPEDNSTVSGDSIVMICPFVEIYREYRLWVVDNEIITASLYKEGNRVHYDQAVESTILEFGHKFVGPDKWQPARAYCLDVFDTQHGLKIGEINNINSAGFYKADMQKLVHALNSMTF